MFSANRYSERSGLLWWAAAAAIVVLGGVSLFSVVNLRQERNRSQQLAAANQALSASLGQMRSEMQSLSQRLSAMTPPTPAPAAPQETAQPATPLRPVVRTLVRPPVRSAAEEQRLRKLEARLADQRKEIADAREQADQARQDLEARMTSQHDELSGSIATNHDQLVALEKRGERNYYEFDLNKSKQFSRVGPLNLSLRNVNLKHKYYDLVMTVDDQQLEKKHVNLYEPLMLTVADRPQPIELVVNTIKNNEVTGYVSEARFKKSELTTGATPPAQSDTKGLQRR